MPNPRKEGDDYTFKEFADAHRISVGTVKNLITAGELAKTYLTPAKPIITWEEAQRFRASRSTSERA